MTDTFESVATLIQQLTDSREKDQLATAYAQPYPHPGGPYPWQQKFYDAGKDHNQRAIISANRVGKSSSIAAEIAMHLTGRYPAWWKGRQFAKPVIAVATSVTNEDVRNTAQAKLWGTVIEEDGKKALSGTGWVPKECIGSFSFRQCGVNNVLDLVSVTHATGKKSLVMHKSFQQGSIAFQGFESDIFWFDEEPENIAESEMLYAEAMTRLADREGIFMLSRTPLFGMSFLIRHFMETAPDGTWWINATWDDAPHLSEKMKAHLLESYPKYQRDTRVKGVPMLGTGAVYPVPDEQVTCKPFEIPSHYRRICGIDFGIDHPAAAAWLAHDADADVLYLYDCYKQPGQTPAYHAQAINAHGLWIPVAWPQDGIQRDKGSGISLAEQYRQRGVNMLWEHAQWETAEKGRSAVSREAGAMELLERMLTGRFKVFDTPACSEFLAEKRMMHRKDGQIVPINDDIESACRYGVMMLRYAVAHAVATMPMTATQADDYDPLSSFSRR